MSTKSTAPTMETTSQGQQTAHIFSGRPLLEWTQFARFQSYLLNRTIEGSLLPAWQASLEIQDDIFDSCLAVLQGRKPLPEHLAYLGEGLRSALHYPELIQRLGSKLFGTARFPGEQLLLETELFTLTYLPPRADVPRQPALFHAGGFLPFSDRIFRFLPEANLFMHFLARGIPVYAMELKGTRQELEQASASFTLSRLMSLMDKLSDVAFAHAGQQKMILEGYCGLAMPALAYLAARPQQAERKFQVAMTMVAPVDGRQCTALYRSIDSIPRQVLDANFVLAELMGGYLEGNQLRAGIDIPLNSTFHKTYWGRFATGWKHKQYAGVSSLADLSLAQRRELAGAYWISPENCRELPTPLDLIRFSADLWLRGIDDDLSIPYVDQGCQLSFTTIIEQTSIQLVGFYGGKDLVVPPATAQVLQRNLGPRYTHVVHPLAGHITYVLSPEVWDTSHPRALQPNPIDLVLSYFPGA